MSQVLASALPERVQGRGRGDYPPADQAVPSYRRISLRERDVPTGPDTLLLYML